MNHPAQLTKGNQIYTHIPYDSRQLRRMETRATKLTPNQTYKTTRPAPNFSFGN